MTNEHIRKPRESNLTAAQRARVEAIRAKNRSAEQRAEEIRVREGLDREYREKKTIETVGDGTTMGSLVEFRRFVMSLRSERERQQGHVDDAHRHGSGPRIRSALTHAPKETRHDAVAGHRKAHTRGRHDSGLQGGQRAGQHNERHDQIPRFAQ